MTPRERLFAALAGKPTDHVPVWLLFPYHATGYYADVRQAPSYRPVFEVSQRYAVTLNRRHFSTPLFAPDVVERGEQLREGDETVQRRTFTWKGKTLTAETRRGPAGARVKRLLATEEDLEFYCGLPVLTDPAAVAAHLERQLPRYQAERAEFPAELGAMMLDLGEPVNPLYHSAVLDEYAVWSLTHDELVRGFLDQNMERLRAIYRWCLERRLAEVHFLVGSELASPPLVSRATFQRWIVPYAKELIGMVRSAGAFAIQHYHGQIHQILPDFAEMAPDALHTIEAPPVGDCTFTQAYEVLGNRVTLIGNIQYDCFRAYTPEEMAAAVRAVLEECRGRRLILSPSAGPYEAEITERMAANYLAFMKTAWEYGA